MAGERILVVEDESIVASDHCDRLEALGYEVAATADSAAEALSKAAGCSPDLALVDIRLRGNGDGVLAAGDREVDGRRAPQDEGERTGPEPGRERHRRRRHRPRPALERPRVLEVHDQWMRRRPPFQLEDPVHGLGVLRIGAEAVDGFRRERDQLACAQRFDRLVDLLLWQPGGDHP